LTSAIASIDDGRDMRRTFAASIALLAVLSGLAFAPFTHVHPAGARTAGVHDDHRDGGLRHAHVSTHEHAAQAETPRAHEGAGRHDHDTSAVALGAGDFVFTPVAGAHHPPPQALPPAPLVVAPLTTVSSAALFQPPAHGPPDDARLPARAPPHQPSAEV
jgi:hypothetical protein